MNISLFYQSFLSHERNKHLELGNLVFFSSLFPMMTDNDDAPQLSAETLKILQEWQKEQQENQAANIPQEDWVCSCYFHLQNILRSF